MLYDVCGHLGIRVSALLNCPETEVAFYMSAQSEANRRHNQANKRRGP